MNAPVNHHDEIDAEKPLDPEVEKVRRKMVRLLGVSLFIMMVGLGAVLYAIVFKYGESVDKRRAAAAPAATGGFAIAPDTNLTGAVDIPEGAQIVSSSINGGQMLLQLRLSNGAVQMWLYDLGSERVFGKIDIK